MCLRQLADFRSHLDEFRDTGFDLAALAVDEPERSQAVRQLYQLPFPILCDTRREVVEAWGVINREEKGGIAEPAIFVLDRNRRVLAASVDSAFMRVSADTLLELLRNRRIDVGSRSLRRHLVMATLADWWRAIRGALRFGLRSPR